MRISKTNNKKLRIIIVLILSLILISGAAFAYYGKRGPFLQKQEIPTDQQNSDSDAAKTGTEAKQNTVDQTEKNGQIGSDPAPNPKPVEGSTKSSVYMEIKPPTQDNGYLYIRTLIQTVTTSGKCTLILNGPNHAIYSADTDIQALPSTSTCKGFNIPLSELQPGDWTATVSFDNDSLSSKATKALVIK